ncbi:MAG: DUF2933 domain-containing protein [Neptuniibacter sp.]
MSKKSSFWCSKSGFAALLMIAVAGYFLLVEHAEHVFPFLPYLFLLMCPLMHLFMHGSHNHGEHKHDSNRTEENTSSQEHRHESFVEQSEENDAYREGYIEGLKAAREEASQKGHKHEQ